MSISEAAYFTVDQVFLRLLQIQQFQALHNTTTHCYSLFTMATEHPASNRHNGKKPT